MTPPITPPRPSVAPSRKRLRVTAVSGTCGSATPCWSAGGAVIPSPASRISRLSGSMTSGSPRSSAVASRAQRKPKTMAIAPPIDEISSGLMMSPTRTTTMPIANPMGHSVGGGRCGSSWSDSCAVSGLGCSGSTRSKSYKGGHRAHGTAFNTEPKAGGSHRYDVTHSRRFGTGTIARHSCAPFVRVAATGRSQRTRAQRPPR